MKYFLDDIKNNFDFFLRNHITLSRKNYNEPIEDFNNCIETQEQKNLYDCLTQKYEMSFLENATCINFMENIFYLDIFDKYLSKKYLPKVSFLDIGSKNWSYAKSEHVFAKSLSDEFYVDGIELDAYRLCSNFYTRYEIAKFYTKGLNNTNYIVGDFMNHQKKYDYIIWILPFITEFPLLKWGLPLKYFKPEEMLRHAYNLLNTNGELLILNQGEHEYAIQQDMNNKLNLPTEYYGEVNNSFNIFKNKRYCSKIIKSN